MCVIKAEGLMKKYGKKQALNEFSAEFGRGVYGLAGPNGAGKTTLMRILAGLLKPDGGRVLFSGTDIKKLGREYFRHISYMPQDFGFYPFFTAMETMQYFSILKDVRSGKEELSDILSSVNLSDVTDKKVHTFSGGMKRRLGIAVSLIGKPDFLIFDEPTAGLDPEERIRFKKLIKESMAGRTVLISTHILSDIGALCDKICLLDGGRLINTVDISLEESSFTGELEKKYMEMMGQG